MSFINFIKNFNDYKVILYGGAIRDKFSGDEIQDYDCAVPNKTRLKEIKSFFEKMKGFQDLVDGISNIVIDDKVTREYSQLKVVYKGKVFDFSVMNRLKIDFTCNNLMMNEKENIKLRCKSDYDIFDCISHCQNRKLVTISKDERFETNLKLITRAKKMLDRGWEFLNEDDRLNEMMNFSFEEEDTCVICKDNDDYEKPIYKICSTCNQAFHLECAENCIKHFYENRDQNDGFSCPGCRSN